MHNFFDFIGKVNHKFKCPIAMKYKFSINENSMGSIKDKWIHSIDTHTLKKQKHNINCYSGEISIIINWDSNQTKQLSETHVTQRGCHAGVYKTLALSFRNLWISQNRNYQRAETNHKFSINNKEQRHHVTSDTHSCKVPDLGASLI